jgi:hypothetical protein
MIITVTFEISPPGVFGLEEPHTTVTPPTSKRVPLGLILDTKEGKVIDRSRESSTYRKEGDKINLSLSLGGTCCRVLDNIITLAVEAEDYGEAYGKACSLVNVFLQHLAARQGLPFKARTLRVEGAQGSYPVPMHVPLGSLRVYNLAKLAKDIKDVESSWSCSDERLARAIEYFEHALLLFEIARGLLHCSAGHYGLCISESFLNLWKCVTSIVGDPSKRKDTYRTRCDQLGLDEAEKQALTRITRLRNDYDVAHYSLSPDRIRVVQQEFGKAARIASGIVCQYSQHLRKGQT